MWAVFVTVKICEDLRSQKARQQCLCSARDPVAFPGQTIFPERLHHM